MGRGGGEGGRRAKPFAGSVVSLIRGLCIIFLSSLFPKLNLFLTMNDPTDS